MNQQQALSYVRSRFNHPTNSTIGGGYVNPVISAALTPEPVKGDCPVCFGTGGLNWRAVIDEHNTIGYVESDPCDDCLSTGWRDASKIQSFYESTEELRRQLSFVEERLTALYEAGAFLLETPVGETEDFEKGWGQLENAVNAARDYFDPPEPPDPWER